MGPGAALEFGPEPADPGGMLAMVEPEGVCGVPWIGAMTEGGL